MNNFSILYVEDDPDILENMTFLLGSYVAKVFTAEDGEEGLASYYKNRPDIVISDIELPKMDGLALVKEIRKDDRTIPIIMITAHSFSEHLSSAIDVGVSSYVTKPFSMDRLKEALQKAILEREELNKHSKLKEQFSLINNNVLMLNTDVDGVITEVTDALIELCGYSRTELVGSVASIVKSGNNDMEIYKELWKTVLFGLVWHGELQNRKKDGSYYWVSLSITPLFNEQSKIKGFTSIQVDVTDQKIAQNQAVVDSLTSLYNRTTFNEVVQKSINIAKRYNAYFTYMMLDIDYFKEYNDSYGHMSGDEALIKVSEVLKKHTSRSDDYAFRIGGEEFVITILGLDENKSLELANSIRESVLDLKIEHSQSRVAEFLSVSIGLYVAKGNHVCNKDEIYSISDSAMYDSKAKGRNRVTMREFETTQEA